MHLEKFYYVYFMRNRSKTIYIGVTGKLRTRVWQHRTGAFEGFTSKYKLDRLVYLERYQYVRNALAREKQLKRWTRIKKIQLIVSMNPTLSDLAEGWYPELMKKAKNSA